MTIDKQIPESQFFHVDAGPVLPSVLALRAFLRMVPQGQFERHVTAQKNDFADWIEHTFNEKDLAKHLRQCKTREQMVWALDDAFAEERMKRVLAQQEGAPAQPEPSPVRVPGGPETADPVLLREDEQFNAGKAQIVATNERISAKYEEVARQLQEAMNNPMPKELEQLGEQLKTRYSELLAKISEARKSGKDALIPALVIRQFVPKLGMANATRERKDFDLARAVLDEAEAELNVVQQTEELDIRKEVLRLAGVDAAQKPKA